MITLVIADIHANLAAFESVLEDAGDFEEIWCLGDLVGYGPDPGECLSLLQQYRYTAVAGNHDMAALGKVDLAQFNPIARAAAEWTRLKLRVAEKRFLEGLPLKAERAGFSLVHGSWRLPIWEYISNTYTASKNLLEQTTTYCFVGHTHVPSIYRIRLENQSMVTEMLLDESIMTIELKDRKSIINPGSVGQPRDGDYRASYMLLNTATNTLELRRVDYDVPETQRRIFDSGLPDRNALRLALGR